MPATRRKPIPVQCSICHKVICRKGDLPRHMLTHASNKEELKFPCPVPGCDHRTLQKSNLQTHIGTHTGKGLHYCPDCPFASTESSRVMEHRKKYHGYRPNPPSHYGRRASRRSAAAPYPCVRYITPEVSTPQAAVRARRPPRAATPDSRASSRNSPVAGSSTSLPSSSPPYVVSPLSSPSTPPAAINYQPSPPDSPLSLSTRTRHCYLVPSVPTSITQTENMTFDFSSLSQMRISSPPPEPTRMVM